MVVPPVYMLRRYLIAQGWIEQRLTVQDLDLFTLSEDGSDTIEIAVPRHVQTFDADTRVMQALRTLSAIEDRPVESVSAAVLGYEFDIIEAALPATRLARESISLRVAAAFLRKEQHLMMHAAAAELAKSSQNLVKDSRTYADACRFGHTFQGSFGFRVLSPVYRSSVTVPLLPVVPRAVVNRILNGIIAANLASILSDTASMVDEAGIGLNASAYDDLAELLERAEADEVSFNFVLSPTIPSDNKHQGPIRLPTSAVGVIRDAANQLRERVVPEDTSVSGQVIRLSSPYLPGDIFHPEGREIGVVWDSPIYGKVTVRVRLTPLDYTEAIRAHEQGREVIVAGKLSPKGKSGFSIDEPVSFAVGGTV